MVTTARQPAKQNGLASTFAQNMSLPVHRWFRFPAGFSAEWVESVLRSHREELGDLAFLDPFAGVATAVLAAERVGVRAYGIEAQPFIARIAQAKLLWYTDAKDFSQAAQAVLDAAKSHTSSVPVYPPLIQKCYREEAVRDLHSLRIAWEKANDNSPSARLAWLAIASILRVSSSAGTAPWQYVLPEKTKANPLPPYRAFGEQVQRMVSDMTLWQLEETRHDATILEGDARLCAGIDRGSVGLIVTSPPYSNNYDYADATRLEMTFFGEVSGWGDLHEKARKALIRSCSQHVSAEKVTLESLLQPLRGAQFFEEIEAVCRALERERLTHGGKKDYHLMVAAYFGDMLRVWQALRTVCADGALVAFVIGDSAPYGVYVPVDRWLAQLALEAGFRFLKFEKIRDRNVKWKNRKHRVPLYEGVLWVKG